MREPDPRLCVLDCSERRLTSETAAPKVGDVVVFVNPDNRSQRYIKRIAALPGNTIPEADGTKRTVPHGHVYVLGDNRQSSPDSREFGFLSISDIVGKARQIYYSSGPDGIRWSRIGKQLSR